MPLAVRSSARRRRKNPDEKLSERPGESTSAQVMAPTRMKLRVRRRENAAGGAAGGGDQQEEEEGTSRERRKNTSNTSTTAAATPSSSPPSSSSAPASARAVMAAEEASPDSKCPICLDRFNNLAYLDRCLHRFCFPCIQEWSHNKAECPLCKQPFTSILHSVRAEDDFKEYTLRPPPANSSVAATVAMVAAMASAARSDHQMRLMLRRHRGADGGETTTRRRRRERGGSEGAGRRAGVWEWYLDSPPLPLLPAVSPLVAEDSEEGEDVEEQRRRGGADLSERGVIFEGLTGLGGAVVPLAPTDRASRRLMTRLAARQRLQREGGTVRRLRERETVAFRRALYRCGIRVRGVAGVNNNSNQGQQQRDITAESFRRNPVHLNRLRPWLRRELTVLYGAHGSLVDIVQRIIMARLARHGLEETPTIEEELRPFLLARTDHFLHELVSFARSPLNLENYDLQAMYEPPASALELDGTSSSSDSSSVIAISEGEEEEERRAGGGSEEAGSVHEDVIQTGSCLSLSAWDDETPGPSYSTAEPSCSLSSLSFSPAAQEAANEEGEEKQGEEEEEGEECLIVGYKKPIAERTPELVQLSSDTEEEEEEKKEEKEGTTEKLPPLPSNTPPHSYLPTIPPSTSGTCRDEQEDKLKEKDGEVGRQRSWSGSSGRSRNSVCTLSPETPGESERRCDRDKKRAGSEVAREKRRRKRSRRGRSGDRLRKSGTLFNPNRSIYPAMMRQHSHSPSLFHSSADSASPLPPSPPDSTWDYHCSQVSPLTSSISSTSSSSSPLFSSPQLSSQTPPTPSLSPSYRSSSHHGEKPGGKRKYKSRHLDSDDKDPTWRPSSSQRRERRRERREKERRLRGRDGGRRRERQRRDAHSRRSREDRSPSVEIIYEGTITSNATHPPARKRRRKQHRKTQHSSPPVIITLDSDSSHDEVNNNSSSSSPLSSQQTVDFSDLPPLPLMHSSGVGGALNAEIGELPVDILDRGSDGFEIEPAGQSEAAGPIAIDNSDNSDGDVDVDVENVEESGSVSGSDEDKGPKRETNETRETRTAGDSSQPAGENKAAPKTTDLTHKRDSEVLPPDSHLLATILNDLKGIEPKCDLSLNFEPNSSLDTRRKHLRDYSNQEDWLTERKHPNHSLSEERPCNQNQVFDPPIGSTSIPPLPLLERGEEGRDVPPLLRQASPVHSHNRNTPPPLKHKDAGSPHLLPVPPVDTDSRVLDHQTILPISPLKRQSTRAPALRGEDASSSSNSAFDMHSSCHSASSKVGALTIGNHLMSHKRPIDSRCSEKSSTSTDFGPQPLPNTFPSSQPHSSRNSTGEISCHRSPPMVLQPASSLSPIDFHLAGCSKEKPAHTDSPSRSCRNKTLNPHFCQVEPTNLRPSRSVAAEGTPAARDVLSGANCNDSSLSVCVSSIDSTIQNPPQPIDSFSSCRRENLSERVSSVPTTAPSGRLSPIDMHPTGPKCPPDLHSSSAAFKVLADNEASLVDYEERSLHGQHFTNPAPPANEHPSGSVSTMTDQHLSQTPLPSTDLLTSRGKYSSRSKPVIDPHPNPLHSAGCDSKPRHHFDPSSNPQFNTSNHRLPVDRQTSVGSHSKNSQRDLQLPADNHISSSQRSFENHWNSNSSTDPRSDSQSPVDERSSSSFWKTHTRLK
uniref:E3 ubiquitin-protein ligase Topors-like n=1 Tax=Semicossyphus pulcher TaxID=241346 RepID=UPI0037E709F9